MPKSILPPVLEREFNSINNAFAKIRDDYKKYNNELLPTHKELAKRIISFLVNVIDYALYNYEELEIENYRNFLGNYHHLFYYGPNGDDSNYLDFDETVDGEPISEFSWELQDDDYKLTKDKLKELKKKYKKALSMFV